MSRMEDLFISLESPEFSATANLASDWKTFTRVLARPRTVNEGGERAYLMRALRNTFYSRLRTASRRPRLVSDSWALPAHPADRGRVPGILR